MTFRDQPSLFDMPEPAAPTVTLHAGDNRASLAALPENSIDAVVTDPPYSLTSITKRFGKPGSAPARREGNDGSFGRVSGGFMGKAWDATGIERDPEFWAAVLRVLKPGGFVFAFSGARTGHWQAVAMEQAGFVMHPMHGWVYGNGFPKGHDAAMAIDKIFGAQHRAKAFNMKGDKGNPRADEFKSNSREFLGPWQPATPEAAAWDGWKYGTQTQKPALEPIYLGQKPYDGKPVESILKWGVGAFNIDGCRVGTEVTVTRRNGNSGKQTFGRDERVGRWENPPGRYPANLLHDGSDEVVALFPESAGQLAKASTSTDTCKTQHVYGSMAHGSGGHEPRGDAGSAARFFNSFPPEACAECGQHGCGPRCWELDDPWSPVGNAPDPIIYHAKANKADRAGSKHPTVKPIGLMRHLIRHICPPGGTVLDPFAGSGTTAEAARLEGMRCVLMEQEPEYLDFLRQRFGL